MAIGIVKGLVGSSWMPPVGFVWKSASSTSPAGIYAGTTWSQITDRAIIGAGSSYANGGTGGATSVALNSNYLPSHTHSGSTSGAGGHSHNSITCRSATSAGEWDSDVNAYYYLTNRGSSGILNNTTNTSTNGAHSHSVSLSNAGSSSSFSILNTYVARYMWERIG